MVFNTNILAGSSGNQDSGVFSPRGIELDNVSNGSGNIIHQACTANATVSANYPFNAGDSNKAPNGKTVTLVMWYYPVTAESGPAGNFKPIMSSGDSNNPDSIIVPYGFWWEKQRNVNNQTHLQWFNGGAPSGSFTYLSGNTSTYDFNEWNCMMFSCKNTSAAASAQLYHNDVRIGATTPAVANQNFGFDVDQFMFAGRTFNFNRYRGAVAEVYYAPEQYLNFNEESNRRKFINADGTPVDLGADGSTPTGSKPMIYLSLREGDDTSAFLTNRGTGASFSVIGTVSVFAEPVSASLA